MTLLGGSSIAFLIQFAAAPVLARLYTPSDFGVFANVMAIIGILAIFSSMRYDVAIVRAGGQGERLPVSRLALRILVIVSLLSLVLMFVGQDLLAEHYEISPKGLLWLVPAILFLSALYGISVNVTNSMGKYKDMSMAKGIYALVLTAVSIYLGYKGVGPFGLLAGLLIAYPLGNLWLLPALKEMTSSAPSKESMSEAAKKYDEFPKWNLPLAAADSLNQQLIFNLVFTSLFGLEAMGMYAITWRYVRAPIKLIQGSNAQVFYREASDIESNRLSLFKISLKYSLYFSVPVFIALFFFGPALFRFVLGDAWTMAGEYASRLAPALAIGLVSGSVSTVPLIFNTQRSFALMSILFQALALAGLYVMSTWMSFSVLDSLSVYSVILSAMYVFFILWFYLTIKKEA